MATETTEIDVLNKGRVSNVFVLNAAMVYMDSRVNIMFTNRWDYRGW